MILLSIFGSWRKRGLPPYNTEGGKWPGPGSLGRFFEREPKRGRLLYVSRGFHPLDVWTVVLSDSP